MAQTSKSAKMHTWKIPLLLCLIHSISIPPTNSYCYWSPIHSPRDFYQTYWPTVCLLSELGLKCLYLRPLWGYELRYVLITPVSHHHPLLSVFNLIRFYSFSPWMFFFPHQWGNMGSLHFIFILKLELESRGHASEVHQKYIFFLWHLLSLES